MKVLEVNSTKHIKELDSSELKQLQILLNLWGYNLAVDGLFGSKTERAFVDFKKKNGLTEPYFLGKTTLESLRGKPPNRKINEEGLELIKEFEGFRHYAYLCPAMVWTIGYGSTFYGNGMKVKKGDYISKTEAERLLKITVESFAEQVEKLIKVSVTDNQFSAMVSLAYNIGVYAFKQSTLLSMLNFSQPKNDIALQFLRWDKANGRSLAGLSRRREKEMQLFLKAD